MLGAYDYEHYQGIKDAVRIPREVMAPTAISMSPTVMVSVMRPTFAHTGPKGIVSIGRRSRSSESIDRVGRGVLRSRRNDRR